MKPQISLREALEDPKLLAMDGPSWIAWRSLLLAMMGEPLNDEELVHYRKLTHRKEAPTERVKEGWIIVGRRGGKSKAISALCCYAACLCEYPNLTIGERGRVVCIAADRAQASIILNYCKGLLEHSPVLQQMIVRSTSEEIELSNGITISVATSSFRRVRDISAVLAVADEIAFFHNEDSSNPDVEIIAALKPTLATTGGMMLGISSPYARSGVLWEAFNRDFGADGDPSVLVAKGATTDLNLSESKDLEDWIKKFRERDPGSARAEIDAEFRTDIESFISLEIVRDCVDPIGERRPEHARSYIAFCDPSGGSSDSMTLAIGHMDGPIAVLDGIREIRAPFNPSDAVSEFSKVLRDYRCSTVVGDRYGGSWVSEQFSQHGILYQPSELNRSEIYLEFLPALNSRSVALLNSEVLVHQLVGLERKRGRGKDIVDHPRGGRDDVANAVAGCLMLCASSGPGGGSSGDPSFDRELEYTASYI